MTKKITIVSVKSTKKTPVMTVSSKYSLVDMGKQDAKGNPVYQLKALRDIADVARKGSFGGLVSSPSNLSQEGECWISAGSAVLGNCKVRDNVLVTDNSVLNGEVLVSDDCVISNCRIAGEISLSGELVLDGLEFFGGAKLSGGGSLFFDSILNDEDEDEEEERNCIKGDCFQCPHDKECKQFVAMLEGAEPESDNCIDGDCSQCPRNEECQQFVAMLKGEEQEPDGCIKGDCEDCPRNKECKRNLLLAEFLEILHMEGLIQGLPGGGIRFLADFKKLKRCSPQGVLDAALNVDSYTTQLTKNVKVTHTKGKHLQVVCETPTDFLEAIATNHTLAAQIDVVLKMADLPFSVDTIASAYCELDSRPNITITTV